MGTQRAYKASTKDYFYGFDTEARQAYDLGMVEIEPNVGFNLTGLYMDDVKEKDDGMKIKSKNVISAQSFVGADVKKKFEIDTHQAVAAIVGGKYYHEFGQKYRAKATMADMNGYYDIISDRLKRNFGLLSAKAQYNYDKFSVSASVNAPVAQDENVYYLFNMGYQF
jgi:outer membrane autotransporter protein